MQLTITALLALAATATAAALPFNLPYVFQPKLVANISASNPAFLSIFSHHGVDSLYISEFQVFSNDNVTVLPDIAAQLAAAKSANAALYNPVANNVNGYVNWPNELTKGSARLFGQKGFLVSSGFLTPGATNGAVSFVGNEDFTFVPITNSTNWFYHRAEVYDVNKDGLEDVITCRASFNPFAGVSSQLLWLEPADRTNPLAAPWIEHIIASNGCDVNFRIYDIDGDGNDEIIAPQFFTAQLTVYWTEDANGSFANSTAVHQTIVDSTTGPCFDIDIVDLNNDGEDDLLLTNHQGNGAVPASSIFAFEFPEDFRTQPWTRHTLATDIVTLTPGYGQASPGAPIAFNPTVFQLPFKPLIAVAGDGAQKAFILTPDSQDPSNWNYTLSVLHDCKCTVGSLAIGDVNHDGAAEIFVPCFESGVVAVYSYRLF